MEPRKGLTKKARAPRRVSDARRTRAYQILVIAGLQNAHSCGQEISERAGVAVEVTTNRRAGLAALRRSSFDVVLVEENLAEGDAGWADQVWQLAGTAIVRQVNFAIVGSSRLSREVKAALVRKELEQAQVRRTVLNEIETDWKLSITGLLLQSEVALQEPGLPSTLQPTLRRIVELAGALLQRLDQRRLQLGH